METSISETKSRLSYYLEQVSTGEPVIIFDRDKPVATLTRYQASSANITALVREGIVQSGGDVFTDDLLRPPEKDDCQASLVQYLSHERKQGY